MEITNCSTNTYTILPTRNNVSHADSTDQRLYLSDISFASEFDGFVLMNPSSHCKEDESSQKKATNYERIFGSNKSNADIGTILLPLVKITATVQKKKKKEKGEEESDEYEEKTRTIYREFKSQTAQDFSSNMVALTPNSLCLLGFSKGDKLIKLDISKCTCLWDKIRFYYHHPDKSIRLSMIMGALSLFLGILSFILGVLSLIIALLP